MEGPTSLHIPPPHQPTAALSTSSPEHSRARKLRPRRADGEDRAGVVISRRRMRERAHPGEETRRGRSWTRSISPGDAWGNEDGKEDATGQGRENVVARDRKRDRDRRRRKRRSRSPSRGSKGISEVDSGGEDHRSGSVEEWKDKITESWRGRSKQRQRYRRRSDYAAAVAEREMARVVVVKSDEGENKPGGRASTPVARSGMTGIDAGGSSTPGRRTSAG